MTARIAGLRKAAPGLVCPWACCEDAVDADAEVDEVGVEAAVAVVVVAHPPAPRRASERTIPAAAVDFLTFLTDLLCFANIFASSYVALTFATLFQSIGPMKANSHMPFP